MSLENFYRCRYKAAITEINRLKQENEKMRECLELIVNTEYSFSGAATRQIAQECLKELEAEKCGLD